MSIKLELFFFWLVEDALENDDIQRLYAIAEHWLEQRAEASTETDEAVKMFRDYLDAARTPGAG